MSDALEFLKRAGTDGRIVSSGDLTTLQIAEAQACKRFYVEPGGGLGWALMPWEVATLKDVTRHAEMIRKADAFDYIAKKHTSNGGMHMSGSHTVVLGGVVGMGRTLLEAVESKTPY